MLINRQLGEFVLLRRLAVGGQSEVFLAMKEGPDEFSRPVVIKALPSKYRTDPQFVDLFYREAFLSARFSHPNVITVHDARILRGEHCMVMDFISGQTVADVAARGYQRGKPPTLNQAVQIVSDACDGLHYTHEFRDLDDTPYSVVHRDVSPQNLMVTYQGVIKVFDFGIAKIQESGAEIDTLAGGKYAYMSPEQCRGEEVDARSDIFSLGIILYELAVGTRLFRRDSKPKVIKAVTEEEITLPSAFDDEFPQFLENVIMKSLEREPNLRYQTAAQMRDDLLQFLAMNSHGRVRHELGEYVSEMFQEERQDIARTVSMATEGEIRPRDIGDSLLENIGKENVQAENEEDLEVPMPEPEADDNIAEKIRAEDELSEGDEPEDSSEERSREERPASERSDLISIEKMHQARDRNQRLVNEVNRLRGRQNILVGLLFLISAVALGLGVHSALSGGQAQTDEPIQIGSPDR
ncbi:MAG: serine/threonine-protein kinase [Myxococcota bacterium]